MDKPTLTSLIYEYLKNRDGVIPSVFEAKEMIKEFNKEVIENVEIYKKRKESLEEDCIYSVLHSGSYYMSFSLAGMEIAEKFKELGYCVKYENRLIKIGII